MQPSYVISEVLQHPPDKTKNLELWEISEMVTKAGEARNDTRTWNAVCRDNTNMIIMMTKQAISWDLYLDIHNRRTKGEVFYQSLAYILYYFDELWTAPRETVTGVKVFDNRDETILKMLAEDYIEGRIR